LIREKITVAVDDAEDGWFQFEMVHVWELAPPSKFLRGDGSKRFFRPNKLFGNILKWFGVSNMTQIIKMR